jgi:hypothetical protein
VKLISKTDNAGTVETPSWEERVQVRLDFLALIILPFRHQNDETDQQWNAEEI